MSAPPPFFLAPPRTALETDPEWWGWLLVPDHADWWQGLSPEHVRAWSSLMGLFAGRDRSQGASLTDQRLAGALDAQVPAAWIAETAMLQGHTEITASLFRRFGTGWLAWQRSVPPDPPIDDDGGEDWRSTWDLERRDNIRIRFDKHRKDVQEKPRLMDKWWVDTTRQPRLALLNQALEAGWDPRDRVRSGMGHHVHWMEGQPDWSAVALAAWVDDLKSLDTLLADPRIRTNQDVLDEALMGLAWSLVDASAPARAVHTDVWARLLACGANPNRLFPAPKAARGSWGRTELEFPQSTHSAGSVLAWSLALGGRQTHEEAGQCWAQVHTLLKPDQWGHGYLFGIWATALSSMVCAAPEMTLAQGQALACLAHGDDLTPESRYDSAMKASNHRNQGLLVGWVAQHSGVRLSLKAAADHVGRSVAAQAVQWDAPHLRKVAGSWANAMEPGDAGAWKTAMEALASHRERQATWTHELKETLLSVLTLALLPTAPTARVRM